MLGGNSALTASSSDQAINSENVSTLQPLFTNGGEFGSPVEANGVVYAVGPNADSTGQNSVEAFDANGVTNCSGTPNQCTPLWTGPVAGSTVGAPAVVNGVVYVSTASSSGPGALYAFDANGVNNCSGSPTVCQPLWTAAGGSSSISPTVANGIVYVAGAAYDANGVTNCSGTPKVCQPLWTDSYASSEPVNTPAVSNGVLYITNNDELFAYSAGGTTNCSGTPTVCSPLWTATMGGVTSMSSPAVSGGVVYTESYDELFAFDANGVTNCSGSPTTCSPLWTAALSSDSASQLALPLAVANGIVYATATGVQAFDASGVTNCSGTPKTCTPLWSYNVGVLEGSPSVANGLVFIGSTGGSSSAGFDFQAFDANGKTNCSGTPAVCNPLWTGLTGTPLVGSVAIANGKVYVSDFPLESLGLDFNTHLYAWVLPPPTTSVWFPSNNASVSGTELLGAGASAGVTQLQFEVSGGPSNLNDQVVGTANLTLYGWLANWNTTTVADGTYTLQSVASYGGEVSGTSAPVTVTVTN